MPSITRFLSPQPHRSSKYSKLEVNGLKLKKTIALVAAVIVLATVSFVAANEAGIFTINIFNSPNSQIQTEISNSTVQGQTNYTNSNAVENITLSNSTLTINVNGQNITITDQGNNIVVGSPSQNVTVGSGSSATSAPQAPLTVTFLQTGPNKHSIITGNATYYEYDFNVTVNVPTSMNYPFGKSVTHDRLNQALAPLVSQYNLATQNYSGIATAAWVNMVVVDGENNFSLFSYDQLTFNQTQLLTHDLFNVFTIAMQG